MSKFFVKEVKLLKTTYYQVMIQPKYNTTPHELRGACYKTEHDAIERCKWEETIYPKTYRN